MGDFLGDLKKGINKSVEDLNKSVKTLEIQSKISNLKKEADAVYAEIGKRAVQENGLEKYGELGDKLQVLLTDIKAEEEKLPAEAADVKKTKICPGCSAETPVDARFCSCCGEMLEDQSP